MVATLNCIGCQACVDMCPVHAVGFSYDLWGEGRASIKRDVCINCGLCDKICPNKTAKVNKMQDKVYAVVSKRNQKTGSSGGVFFEMATEFINNSGIVFGAAFNENLKLIHKKTESTYGLRDICKSKYIHSDMTGVYNEIKTLLSEEKKVMFVGTPCQVSAVKNLFGKQYCESLFLVDILCHGTGSQKVFDACIDAEEKKLNGKITEFNFRAKSRKAEHSYTYRISIGEKIKEVSGYAFEFPYYYSYLKYTIFSDVCYFCKYAQACRVGDVTLGDFWGIHNYNASLSDKKGVSMVLINTENGKRIFDEIKKKCDVYEYPIEYASAKNDALCRPVSLPTEKKRFLKILNEKGEQALVDELTCKNIKKQLIYSKIPQEFKKIYNKMRGRK